MWKSFEKPGLGFANEFSQKMANLNRVKPFLFPDLASASKLFLFSDYSGAHKDAAFNTYSFFLSNHINFEVWDKFRLELRGRHSLGSSIISYKKLNDGRKFRAMPEFLAINDCLEGILVTFLVDKSLPSLFDVKPDLSNPVYSEFTFFDKNSFERLLRIVQFAAFLLAGLSGDTQEIFWFTDEDEIVADEKRMDAFAKIAAKSIDVCVPTGNRTLRLGTTALDNDTLILEDMAAIPDLACGGLTEIFSRTKREQGVPTSHNFELLSSNISDKCRLVIDWLARPRDPLAKLVFCIGKNSLGQRYFNKLDFRQTENLNDNDSAIRA